jgi:hypothetical protein
MQRVKINQRKLHQFCFLLPGIIGEFVLTLGDKARYRECFRENS